MVGDRPGKDAQRGPGTVLHGNNGQAGEPFTGNAGVDHHAHVGASICGTKSDC